MTAPTTAEIQADRVSIARALERRTAIKTAQQQVTNLKSNPSAPMTKKFYSNKQAHDKISALEAEIDALKTQLTSAKAVNRTAPRAAVKPTATQRTASAPVTPGTTTAASFATPPLAMTRAEFSKLSPSDKLKFSQNGGKLTK